MRCQWQCQSFRVRAAPCQDRRGFQVGRSVARAACCHWPRSVPLRAAAGPGPGPLAGSAHHRGTIMPVMLSGTQARASKKLNCDSSELLQAQLPLSAVAGAECHCGCQCAAHPLRHTEVRSRRAPSYQLPGSVQCRGDSGTAAVPPSAATGKLELRRQCDSRLLYVRKHPVGP